MNDTSTLPLNPRRTPAEWANAVQKLEASPTGVDDFAYWNGFDGTLKPTEVEIVAKVAWFLEQMSHGDSKDSVAPKYIVLGALAFAKTTTNDLRQDIG